MVEPRMPAIKKHVCFKALKGRNTTARGATPGRQITKQKALKGRNKRTLIEPTIEP